MLGFGVVPGGLNRVDGGIERHPIQKNLAEDCVKEEK
jgi:hypothetical protein